MRQGAVIVVLLMAALPFCVTAQNNGDGIEQVLEQLEQILREYRGQREQRAQSEECTGKWKGKKISEKELAEVLGKHYQWLISAYMGEAPEYSDERYANLCEVNLRGANLTKADLRGVNLTKANLLVAKLTEATLWGANLTEADLASAYLTKADLRGADLTKAKLTANLTEAVLANANLTQANLGGANLTEAFLRDANLTQANLRGTNLTQANLAAANLTEANLASANLDGVLYEPKDDALPLVTSLRSARNLHRMRFEESPHALQDLRNAFKENNYRQQEREITYAIKRSEWRNAKKDGQFIEPLFNRALFDIPVAYGLRPGRALLILISLIPFFALFYGISLSDLNKKSGIWRVWPPDRADTAMGSDKPELMTERGWRVHMYALYFSLLSAFRIGWRELNVGNWIARIQPRTYVMQATGWVRTVSGIQSLISVYLVAIWALSYFGRPFE